MTERTPVTQRTSARFMSPGKVLGPMTRFPGHRWVAVPATPEGPLPAIPEYACRRAAGPVAIDGNVDGPDWQAAQWSAPFGRIDTGEAISPETRVALLWDDENLYAAFRVEDHDVRASATTHHEQVYAKDDDVEIFVEGVGGYYEMGVNPISTVYEFRWTWVEPVVERRDFDRLDELFSVADYIYYRALPGDRMGRVGEMDFDLPGLQRAVRIQGVVNAPHLVDDGWTATIALPWTGLRAISHEGRGFPPRAGDTIRIQSYRAHHDREADSIVAADGSTLLTPFVGQTWSAMGNHNPHDPDRWVSVRFVDEA